MASTMNLLRYGSTPQGTFGILTLGAEFFYTVERPWDHNKPSVSCIPAGTYGIQLGTFYGGDGPGGKPDYPAYELLNVPGRANIKIHKANTSLQVNGCIAVGKELGTMGKFWAVERSREAYDELMVAGAMLDPREITIAWADPEP